MEEKLTIEATIPTVQYGNVRSSITLDRSDFESWEDMRDNALRKTKSISDMVAGEGYTFDVRGLSIENKSAGTTSSEELPQQLTSELTGTSVFYNDAKHKYTDKDGKEYLSGSKFPQKFYPDFDSKMIIDQLMKKYPDISGMDISKMWSINGEASTALGKAIHSALENYDKHSSIGAVLAGDGDRNKALSKNPLIRAIVEKFHEGRETEDVMSEAFVANEEFHLAGTIDRLKFIDREKKIVRVQDFKTDGDIKEKRYQVKDSPFKGKIDNNLLGYHFLQLSFYALILQEAGYTVEGLDVFWLNGEKLLSGENPWETFTSDVIDIKKEVKG